MTLYRTSHTMPSPSNISYAWNFGSLLATLLGLQITSGLFLSMHYSPLSAFDYVSELAREGGHGWLLRSAHAAGASFFFMCLYLHLARGLYYGSAKTAPLVWASGMLILITSMAVAFLGYVLVWGNMSYWGATVITSMLSTVPYLGDPGTQWMWGSWAVDDVTINRFFAFHFLLPFLIAAIALTHVLALHQPGSSNPSGLQKKSTGFHPYFSTKDVVGFLLIGLFLSFFVVTMPTTLADPENYLTQNEGTPEHIQPEWYFLWAYAMLRSIPDKLLGVCTLAAAIIFLFLPCVMWPKTVRNCPTNQFLFWASVANFIILTWIGACPVEPPYVLIGQTSTAFFFILMTLLLSPHQKFSLSSM